MNDSSDPTTDEFVEKVDDLVKDSPMERFFEGKEEFIQEVAQNAVELEKDTSTSLGSPEVLPKTIKVSLHQQVIYCGKFSLFFLFFSFLFFFRDTLVYSLATLTKIGGGDR